ncbi:MAG: TIM barrel protein [Clostridiaceae bacterium]|nr:TIM barrel protein [Clostridiaceae bacterium]
MIFSKIILRKKFTVFDIGTAGCPQNFYEEGGKSSLQMPAWLVSKGLNVFEYQCGKGVRFGQKFANDLKNKARQHGVTLTLHAPYYINLATVEPAKQKRSAGYILDSLAAAQAMGAIRIVVHPGSAKPQRGSALERAVTLLKKIIAEADERHLLDDVTLCPELMGKRNQLGNLDEVIALCQVDDRLIPCIDFGHLNARTSGSLKSPSDYRFICERLANELGTERMRTMHIHFSQIEFGKAGEIRHLTFEDQLYGPYFSDFSEVIHELKMRPIFICESAGTQDVDALLMKEQLGNPAGT